MWVRLDFEFNIRNPILHKPACCQEHEAGQACRRVWASLVERQELSAMGVGVRTLGAVRAVEECARVRVRVRGRLVEAVGFRPWSGLAAEGDEGGGGMF